MNEKSATVLWTRSGKSGYGQVSTETGALTHYPYSFASRTDESQPGTNPEELLAAAHAACFTMAFSFACEKAGFRTERVETQARVSLSPQVGGFFIDRIMLHLKAVVPGMAEGRFQEIALAAKRNCSLSQALAGVPEIGLEAKLEGHAHHEAHQ